MSQTLKPRSREAFRHGRLYTTISVFDAIQNMRLYISPHSELIFVSLNARGSSLT